MTFLQDLWNDEIAQKLASDELELLRYRSNLLGADLRITNFGGGNTSSKISMRDPFDGKEKLVLAVKGSGGDLGSIKREGFALLYMDKLIALQSLYPGEAREDEMVSYYPLAAFANSKAPASIDTPLHAFLPFPHVDHLHPDWAIALAASANGLEKMAEFNQRFGHRLAWVSWQRPGFELGLQLQRAIESDPQCDGIVLGSHGLFTWGQTQRESYLNSIRMIDDLGVFLKEHEGRRRKPLFGGPVHHAAERGAELAISVLPYLRGQVATKRRSIAHVDSSPEALEFVNSQEAKALSELGTSCPDHFIRTRIRPLYVEWNPGEGGEPQLREAIAKGAGEYRDYYGRYYNEQAAVDSPALRDPNPSVVLIPGLGMFTFGKNKSEARITAEFYRNAIRVIAGATTLDEGGRIGSFPQAKSEADSAAFKCHDNYVSLPAREAFRIEYWALEEAKLQRMAPEQRFSRRIFLVVGAGSGIGRSTALQLAKQGAHLILGDKNAEAAANTATEVAAFSGKEAVTSCGVDISQRESIRAALRVAVETFGGLDGVINTAAVFIAPNAEGVLADELWQTTFHINITGNYLLADEAAKLLKDQGLPATLVLTSSANAVVPKRGSEAYDVSKTAVNQLIRELAVGLAPVVRVNGIAPATVVEGSTMFPRERLIPSLNKYGIVYHDDESTESLRTKLANFYAQRTLTKQPITPADCAAAICWLSSDESGKTSGHVIPVDGGLPEAFLR